MTKVRMLRHFSGGRYDGREWPEYKGLIDVPAWEAEALISAGNAESPDSPELDRGYDVLAIQEADYEPKLKRLDGDEEEGEEYSDYDSDFDRNDGDSDFDREEDVTPQVKRPYSNANKAEWVKYAVYLGASETEAKKMTKDALIEKFGS